MHREDAAALSLRAHVRRHGPMPLPKPADLLDEVERSGLTGRGGASFRMHRQVA